MVKDRVWQIVLDLVDRDLIDKVEAEKYKIEVKDIALDIIDLVCDIENDYCTEPSNVSDKHPSHPDDKGGI